MWICPYLGYDELIRREVYTERSLNFRFYHYLFSAKCIASQFYLTALAGLIVKLF
jgi:hypothetical protein